MRRFLRKLHLWFIRHGVEFDNGEVESHGKHNLRKGCVDRHISIAVNHRFVVINLLFEVHRGVYRDELNKPHAEIAAQREQWY